MVVDSPQIEELKPKKHKRKKTMLFSSAKEHLMFYPIEQDSDDEDGPKRQVRSPLCLLTIFSFYGFRTASVGLLRRLCKATNILLEKTSGLLNKLILDYKFEE